MRGHEAGCTVGRYVVLHELGSGGMGVVLAAHDPELDRRIALKVLRPGHWGRRYEARQRLIGEAQAMASLTHHNVVKVLDVGTHGEDVFIAMELIDGDTLTGIMRRGRTAPDEIVRIFREAARGLAAAHRVGLVHRDFKPDNVMVERGGRVVVLDFGLARSSRGSSAEPSSEETLGSADSHSLTEAGTVMGTPAYMAPEQHKGEVRPASDQFALCASIYEALYGVRPFAGTTLYDLALAKTAGDMRPQSREVAVPDRVRKVIARGLRADPDERFPSMEHLVAALERGRPRRRMLFAIGAGALVVGSSALAFEPASTGVQCEPADSPFDDDARAAVSRALLDQNVPYAEFTERTVLERLDAYAAEIVEARVDACRATHVEHTQSDADLDLRSACLGARTEQLHAAVEVLAAADAAVVEHAVETVQGLAPVAGCADLDNLRSAVPQPEGADARAELARLQRDLARARALHGTAQFEAAAETLQALRPRAEALGHDPLLAEVRHLQSDVAHARGDFPAAVEHEQAAAEIATRSRYDRLAADAHRGLAFTIGHSQAHPEQADPHLRAAEAIVARLGDPPELVSENVRVRAVIEFDRGDYEAALDLFDHAGRLLVKAGRPVSEVILGGQAQTYGALREHGKAEAALREAMELADARLGPGHPSAAKLLTRLAMLQLESGRIDEARETHRRVLAIRKAALGEDHPHVAFTYNNLAGVALTAGDIDEARDDFEKARAILLRHLGPDHPDIGRVTLNIAELLKAHEQYAEAERELERGVAILVAALGEDHPEVGRGQNNLAAAIYDGGDPERAVGAYRVALATLERATGPDNIDLAYALVGIGQSEHDRGAPEAAVAPLRRALALREKGDGVDPVDLANTQYWLAKAIVGSGGDRAEAKRLAQAAIDAFVAAGDRPTVRPDAEAWFAATF